MGRSVLDREATDFDAMLSTNRWADVEEPVQDSKFGWDLDVCKRISLYVESFPVEDDLKCQNRFSRKLKPHTQNRIAR